MNNYSKWILDDLAKSGLNPEDFDLPLLEGDNCYKIQYPDTTSGKVMLDLQSRPYCRKRMSESAINNGSPKYLTETGAGIRVYIPLSVDKHFKNNPNTDIIATEGEKKAIACTKQGIPCLGLAGIWNWIQSKSERTEYKELHPDLASYLAQGRNFIVIYDSDATDPKKALDFDDCAYRFAEQLAKFKCQLQRVNLPGDSESKVGLDDYLLKHSSQELTDYIQNNKIIVSPTENPRVWYREPSLQNLVNFEGMPTQSTERSFILNQSFFAGLYPLQHKTLFESNEDKFYSYTEDSGLWKTSSIHTIKNQLSIDFSEFFRTTEPNDYNRYLTRRSDSFFNSVAGLMKGKIECNGMFVKDAFRPFIHCLNGVLDLSDVNNITIKSFAPDWYSRNMLPIKFDESATCPRFINELLKPQNSDEEIDLIQKWGGSVILGGNPSQNLMLLTGAAGGGKGCFSELMEKLCGLENTAQLRTSLLNERFEIRNFIGKTLLLGKDVSGDFLMTKGAEVIKCLCGHDYLDAESKSKNETTKIRGDFGILINCNSRLRVRLDGDIDAWRRRLLIIEYNNPPISKPIINFSNVLFESEGAGILNFFIQGAIRLVNELKQFGRIQKTESQQKRIDRLLEESNSALHFVQNRIMIGDGDISTEECNEAYAKHCEIMGWKPLPIMTFDKCLPDLILNEFGLVKAHDISRNGKSRNGYRNLKILEVA